MSLERGVLPRGHEKRCDRQLDALIAALTPSADAPAPEPSPSLPEVLASVAEDERAAFRAALPAYAAASGAYLLEFSVAAHLVERARGDEAALEGVLAATRRWLSDVVASAPPDALLDAAEVRACAPSLLHASTLRSAL